jgi:hypothetical protein
LGVTIGEENGNERNGKKREREERGGQALDYKECNVFYLIRYCMKSL